VTSRQATRYLLWYGDKVLSGDAPTAEEFEMFIEAREISKEMARKLLRIDLESCKYVPGQPFS